MSNKNVNVRKSQEITFCLLAGILMFMAMMVAGRAEAGVALGATRVIYKGWSFYRDASSVCDEGKKREYLAYS